MPDWKEAVRQQLMSVKLEPASESLITEELCHHLDDLYQDLEASGIAPEECSRLVLAQLQGAEAELLASVLRRRRAPANPTAHSSPGGSYLRRLTGDLKIALRSLRTRPAFSALVIGLLALGIAGNAVVFSIFDGLFLRPLPFTAPDRLVDLDETAPKWNLPYVGVSNLDLYRWRKDNSTFDGMAFYRLSNFIFGSSNGAAAEQVQGAQVSRDMLDVLQLKPLLGRNFTPDEDRPGGPKVVLLNFGFWAEHFQRDRQVIGQTLTLDEEPYTVIGVLPPEAVFPDRARLWIPLAADPNMPAGYYVRGVGRLKAAVSMEQAQADLLRIHKAMVPEHRVNEITSPILISLGERYVGALKTAGVVLLGAVGVVLLVACVNIAALMMVRGVFRARELAIRAALGATQRRIVAQLLTENLVLAALGGLAGVVLGEACLHIIAPLLATRVPEWVRFSLDARFAAFCLVIIGAAAMLFGLAPSLQASRVDIRGALAEGAARATSSRIQRATLAGLVVCEIALALTISISAGLLLQAFRKVLQVDPGFRPENVMTFQVGLPEPTYPKPEQRVSYYENLLNRLRTLPGVSAAGVTSAPPLGGNWGGVFEAEGITPGRQNENPTVLQVAASPGYFQAVGMTLLAGRTFDAQDDQPTAPMVAIVNETFAKHFWGTQSPIGKRIRRPGINDSGPLFNTWYEVVGLLRDEKHAGLDQAAGPGIFLPYAKAALAADKNDSRSLRVMTILLRGSTDPTLLSEPARAAVQELDPAAPMYGVAMLTAAIDRSLWTRRAYSWLFGGFAMVAIVLAVAGVYGIVSYAVSQRTQEIGIRMAVGARPGQVLLEVLRQGMSLVAIGVGTGVAGALVATRFLQTLLFGVSARDPFIFVALTAGVVGVGLLANLVPARRAAAIDPMHALHFR